MALSGALFLKHNADLFGAILVISIFLFTLSIILLLLYLLGLGLLTLLRICILKGDKQK